MPTMHLGLRACNGRLFAPTVTLTAATTATVANTAYALPAGAEMTLLHRRPLAGVILVFVVSNVGYRVLWREPTTVAVAVDPSAATVTWDVAEPHRGYLPTVPATLVASV